MGRQAHDTLTVEHLKIIADKIVGIDLLGDADHIAELDIAPLEE